MYFNSLTSLRSGFPGSLIIAAVTKNSLCFGIVLNEIRDHFPRFFISKAFFSRLCRMSGVKGLAKVVLKLIKKRFLNVGPKATSTSTFEEWASKHEGLLEDWAAVFYAIDPNVPNTIALTNFPVSSFVVFYFVALKSFHIVYRKVILCICNPRRKTVSINC